MRILQLIGVAVIIGLGLRWAWKEGSRPPEEEKKLVLGYYDDGEPIISGDDCDVEKTLGLWRDLHRRARGC
jgi:hypothetical protein